MRKPLIVENLKFKELAALLDCTELEAIGAYFIFVDLLNHSPRTKRWPAYFMKTDLVEMLTGWKRDRARAFQRALFDLRFFRLELDPDVVKAHGGIDAERGFTPWTIPAELCPGSQVVPRKHTPLPVSPKSLSRLWAPRVGDPLPVGVERSTERHT